MLLMVTTSPELEALLGNYSTRKSEETGTMTNFTRVVSLPSGSSLGPILTTPPTELAEDEVPDMNDCTKASVGDLLSGCSDKNSNSS
ncbi:hypothetical protein WISP_31406 [Willisornis vidua]|uniref:Uncharacterized protein n=1 Tax=Willisornis vidua TaxID=1566151 RepID=A0ABQ9DQB8_9PASS|nr:hypothetical protein WISP_31406 [Willisornis vidua]